MEGWNLKSGECSNFSPTERELWEAVNHFFNQGHKATTYKFCFFKCLLDLLPESGETTVEFSAIFARFTEIYWELIAKYGLNQAHTTSRYAASKIETIIDEFILTKNLTYATMFRDIPNDWSAWLVAEVEKHCSNNVVGAFYTSTNCLFYSFSRAEHIIKMNAAAVEFCKTHMSILEELNYYHWAKMLEKINGDTTPKALITKMSKLGKLPTAEKCSIDSQPITAEGNQRYSLADIIPWNF